LDLSFFIFAQKYCSSSALALQRRKFSCILSAINHIVDFYESCIYRNIPSGHGPDCHKQDILAEKNIPEGQNGDHLYWAASVNKIYLCRA